MDGGTGQASSGLSTYPYRTDEDEHGRDQAFSRQLSRVQSDGHRGYSAEPQTTVHIEDNAPQKVDRAQSSSTNPDFSPHLSPLSPHITRTISDPLEFDDSKSVGSAVRPSPQLDDLAQQVKAAVPADDPTLSIDTPRMWTLALTSAILGSSMNLLYSLRYPSVTLTPIVALLVVYPIGHLWDRILKRPDDPTEIFVNGRLSRSVASPTALVSTPLMPSTSFSVRFRLWLGQGRWNRKEHACVFVSSNVSFVFAFATDIITEQVKFYGQDLLGYSLAGIMSDFLVKPKEMVWPSNLIATSMLSTLHSEENEVAGGWRMSRWQFFVAVFFGAFSWYFLPGLLIPALSYFNAMTWAAPDSTVIASLFGVTSGLGMLPLTFDWSQIAYTGSPLIVPFWAAMNVLGGLVVVMWLIAPLLYYTNTFYSSYLPILDASVYDNKAAAYDISKILTPSYLFDQKAYHGYSAVYLPMTYALAYAVQFASMTALLTHTACNHGKTIWKQFQTSALLGQRKWHRRDTPETRDCPEQTRSGSTQPLLSSTQAVRPIVLSNQDIPLLWYLTVGIISMFTGMFVVEYYDIHLPWWSMFLALAICLVLLLPIGIVMAMTNLQISIYLISQIIAGVMFPGRGVANMIFVTYTYITSTQALKFCSDLKLGLYMNIPRRILFKVQILATIASSFAQIGVLNWAFDNVRGICTLEAVNGFTCPIARVHFNGSVIWGVIGPQRFFGAGALYRPLIWAFPVGAVLPVIVWMISRREGASQLWRKINLPVVFGSLSWIPPATGLNFSVWALVCFIFNYVVRRRHDDWWKKYNTILSAGLDAGTSVSVLVIFFSIVYWGFADNFAWWGTEVYKQGCDWKRCAYQTLSPGERFGPAEWRLIETSENE